MMAVGLDLVTLLCICIASILVVNCATPDQPPTAGSWTIDNCMRMNFGARFTIPVTYINGTNSTVDVDLASWAMSKESTCNDQAAKLFLRYYLDDHDSTRLWKFILDFMKEGGKYKLDQITIQYVLDKHFPPNIKNLGHTYVETTNDYQPSARIGSYIGCDEVDFRIGLSSIGVRMTNVKMQPFARDVFDGGFGTKTACTKPSPPSTKSPPNVNPTGDGSTDSSTLLIMVFLVAGIVAVTLIVAGVVFIVRRNRNANTAQYSDIKY